MSMNVMCVTSALRLIYWPWSLDLLQIDVITGRMTDVVKIFADLCYKVSQTVRNATFIHLEGWQMELILQLYFSSRTRSFVSECQK